MHSGTKLVRALRSIIPESFDGDVARRVGLAGLLIPLRSGGRISDLKFLYAGRRRNRFTPGADRSACMWAKTRTSVQPR